MTTVPRFLFALACVLGALCAGERAQAFTLGSLNTLHLGWGTNKCAAQATKNGYLVTNFVGTTPDVVVMQEVMPKLGGVPTLWVQPPGNYYAYQSNSQGASSYRETYAILIRNRPNLAVDPASVNGALPTCYTGPGFSRPPCGVVVNDNGTKTWVLDYHAIFGNVGARATEVKRMVTVVAWFQNVNVGGVTIARVVAGGDWNFDGTKLQALLGSAVAPDVKTSLNPKGALSSNYDHFLCVTATCNTATSINPPPAPWNGLPSYRKCFSDHLGVSIVVS
jgi:hypothetical protein